MSDDTCDLVPHVCKDIEQALLSQLCESKLPRIHDLFWGNTQIVRLRNDANLSLTNCNDLNPLSVQLHALTAITNTKDDGKSNVITELLNENGKAINS